MNESLVHSQKRPSCNKLVDNLQQHCYEQADIRMRSHGLRQLVDDKHVASFQQTCSKLSRTDLMQIVSTDLMQVVANRLDANCREQT